LLTTHWIYKRWWTVDFSKREGYQLQPAKSVILPVKSKIKTIVTNEGFWKIDNRIMPVVDKATHIGITRSDTNSARTTVDENIRKARRATYSLMGTGLHGENVLDPETSISLLDLTGRITLLAGCSWYPSRLLKSTVHHRLYIQWVVSNQCNIICAGRSTDINISNFPT
jgi:hypothetical protein